LPLTSGVIQTATGLQTLPGPLTLELLREVRAPWQPLPSHRELITPVAAALLAELAQFEQPVMTIARTGSALSLEQDQLIAQLSMHLGELIDPERLSGEVETDQVTVIETHIDTMTGELLGALLDRLLEAGALDVGYTPLQMKKNRPGTRLTVICPEEAGERLALLLLRETNTLGVRIQQVQRRKAQRRQERIETPLGSMLVKIKSLGGQIVSVSPEYEECLRIARQRQIPLAEVYEVARTTAQSLIIGKKDDKERT
ncbi:MAG TPA: nickel insertion protein, partial [Ktedonobacteraceae bacterium]